MKTPTRPIRTVDPFTSNYDYYDHETVEQDDGTLATFSISNHTQEKGWVFQNMVDKYGFMLWEDKDRQKMWNDKITIEQFLLLSKCESSHYTIQECFGPAFKISNDEFIYPYEYGGVLSGRGGWFVVKKNEPNKIIRSKQIWLS